MTVFNNPFFQKHYNSSIAPIIERVDTAPTLMDQHRSIGDLADAVETAATLFPFIEDIRALRKLQERVIEQVQSPVKASAQTADPKVMQAFNPVGIPRDGMNCWANAVLQTIVNAPSLAEKILQKRTNIAGPLSSLLRRYYETQMKHETVASTIDGQTLRMLSDRISSDNRSVMEDPVDSLESILQQLEFHSSFKQERLYADGEKIESRYLRDEQMIQFDMMGKYRAFKDLIESFFLAQVDDGSLLRLKFHQTPEDLFFHVKRYGQKDGKMIKVDDDIEQVPSFFNIDPKYLREGSKRMHFELASAIIHLGSTLDSGHYVAIVKKNNEWFLADDQTITPLTSQEAQEHFKQAYVLHYRKAERIAEEEDFEIIDIDGTEPTLGWTVLNIAKNALFAATALFLTYL